MRLSNFKIEQIITKPGFLQNSANNGLVLIAWGLVLICIIPLIIIVLVFFLVISIINLFFNKDNEHEAEIEDDGFNIWYPFYENDFIKIDAMEIIPEDEFNNDRWHGPTLIKFQSVPSIQLFESTYFNSEIFIFCNTLIVCLVDKDLKIRESEIFQVDLITLEVKGIAVLDEFYQISFELIDVNKLKLICNRNKKIEIIITNEVE
ncbi:MAG: hypothetical protein ACEQSR_09620 [Candidatus Methylacidiphilales bacterium]